MRNFFLVPTTQALAAAILSLAVLPITVLPALARTIIIQSAPVQISQTPRFHIYGSSISTPVPVDPRTGRVQMRSNTTNYNYRYSNPRQVQQYDPYRYYDPYDPDRSVSSNRVERSVLVNPTIIDSDIYDSVLVNPVIIQQDQHPYPRSREIYQRYPQYYR